ncbi:Uncharacterized protein FWK35_00005207 [Aphis craccivora]|uniref:Uncharacterized protein n=1 Tax=Aphis craccivora TaxID=307492 RepID=A0A6G0ZA17_APHCR|nr:Uncharacterized protein FWK35_00005207 [Aphis craccivora]
MINKGYTLNLTTEILTVSKIYDESDNIILGGFYEQENKLSIQFSKHLTVGKQLLLTCIMHQGYLLLHRKPPPKFEIGTLFRLVMLYTDTKKKKEKDTS